MLGEREESRAATRVESLLRTGRVLLMLCGLSALVGAGGFNPLLQRRNKFRGDLYRLKTRTTARIARLEKWEHSAPPD
jgi:hypothetical protein